MSLSFSLLLKGCSRVTDKQRHIKVILMAKSLRVQIGARAVSLGWERCQLRGSDETSPKPYAQENIHLPTPSMAPT